MNKFLFLIFGTVQNVISLLCGCIFFINPILSWKYKLIITVLPDRWLRKSGDASCPDFLGGVVYLRKSTVRGNPELLKAIILHEKGHCRSWGGIPGFDVVIAAIKAGGALQGHGYETADYEYAADRYCHDHGGDMIGLLEAMLDEFEDIDLDIGVADCENRIANLKK